MLFFDFFVPAARTIVRSGLVRAENGQLARFPFPLQNFLHFLAAHRKGTCLAVSGPSEEGGTLAAVSPQELYGLLRQVHIPLAARQFGGGYKALVAPREFPLRQGLPTQQQEPRLGWPTLRQSCSTGGEPQFPTTG